MVVGQDHARLAAEPLELAGGGEPMELDVDLLADLIFEVGSRLCASMIGTSRRRAPASRRDFVTKGDRP